MAERCDYLGRAAERLAEVAPTWVDIVQAETGATINVAKTMQVSGAFIDRFRYYSRPRELDVPLKPLASPATALAPAALISGNVIHQPVGVVAAITPYNFPLVNVAGKIAPALAMGNTCIIKPAPQDPLGSILLGELLDEIFPPGVVNVLVGSSPEVGAALVDSPDVNMISFTGSSPVGAKIMEAGGKTMKRLLMELGGKGALIMTEDATSRPPSVASPACGGSTAARSARRRPGSSVTATSTTRPSLRSKASLRSCSPGDARETWPRWSDRSSPRPTATGSRRSSRPASTTVPAWSWAASARRSTATSWRRPCWPTAPRTCTSCRKRRSGRSW